MSHTMSLETLDKIVEYALEKGASDARVKASRSNEFTYGICNGRPEKLERSDNLGVSIRLYKGKKKQAIQATHLNIDMLKSSIDDALATMDHLPEDPYIGLASPDQIVKQDEMPSDLDICDTQDPDEEELMAMLEQVEESALENKLVTNSKGGSIGWERYNTYLVMSNGFRGSYEGTSGSFYIQPIAGEKDNMQVDYDYSHAIHFKDLKDPAAVGQKAAEKVVSRLNPQKIKTGTYPVYFDADIAGSIFSHFLSAISGSNIARGVSFLKNKKGEKLFKDNITLRDDPFKKRGFGSRPFDSEGMGFKQINLIENGVFNNWLLDLTSARKLEMEDDTSGFLRGSGQTTNLTLDAGKHSQEELFKEFGDGFLVTDLMSRPNSLVNGDYSVGASGFWIENGKIAYPVHEMTVSANLIDIFAALTPANDLTTDKKDNFPTIYLGNLSVGGA